jgi:hypothetical protein
MKTITPCLWFDGNAEEAGGAILLIFARWAPPLRAPGTVAEIDCALP